MDQREIQRITKYIFLDSAPKHADLALVFGTRHQQAIDKVYALYSEGLTSNILVSGGINRITGRNEADEMHRKLLTMGVRQEHILLENRSTNTLENVLFSKKIIEDHTGFKNIDSIIAVVKHYHSRRALMTLTKHFPKHIELIPVTYDVCGFTKEHWFEDETGQKCVLKEWSKIPEYLTKGDIEELHAT
ncbi:MAG: YdcF family protein [Patescibacteria group bacterium]